MVPRRSVSKPHPSAPVAFLVRSTSLGESNAPPNRTRAAAKTTSGRHRPFNPSFSTAGAVHPGLPPLLTQPPHRIDVGASIHEKTAQNDATRAPRSVSQGATYPAFCARRDQRCRAVRVSVDVYSSYDRSEVGCANVDMAGPKRSVGPGQCRPSSEGLRIAPAPIPSTVDWGIRNFRGSPLPNPSKRSGARWAGAPAADSGYVRQRRSRRHSWMVAFMPICDLSARLCVGLGRKV